MGWLTKLGKFSENSEGRWMVHRTVGEKLDSCSPYQAAVVVRPPIKASKAVIETLKETGSKPAVAPS
jgi:hypothetical protein